MITYEESQDGQDHTANCKDASIHKYVKEMQTQHAHIRGGEPSKTSHTPLDLLKKIKSEKYASKSIESTQDTILL